MGDLESIISQSRRTKRASRVNQTSKANRVSKVKMDNQDSKARMDSLVSKVKEIVKVSQVKVLVKDSRAISMNTVMDNSVVAQTMDMVISLVTDKDRDSQDRVMAVLKHRDKDLKTGLVMNVAEDMISLD